MYVSTSLHVLDVDARDERMLARDFTVISGEDRFEPGSNGKFASKPTSVPAPRTVYRRLDPEYYAWLRGRIGAAAQAAQAGRIPAAAYDALVAKFRAVHAAAVESFGADALKSACERMGAEYVAPVPDADIRGVVVGREIASERPETSKSRTHSARRNR